VSTLSTHVLDTALGRPAPGIRVTLSRGGKEIGSAVTDADGRAKDLQGKSPLAEGAYGLTFSVGPYFAAAKRETFYDTIVIEFRIGAAAQHYHVPLLLSPFGYSTYRGS
jgi:5-hydroxyisourate hydrolase